MQLYNYFIRSDWGIYEETPAAIGGKLVETLDRFSSIDAALNNWLLTDAEDFDTFALSDVRSSIAGFVEDNAVRDDFDEPEPESGYALEAVGSAVVSDEITPQTASFSVTAGGLQGGELNFEFGDVDLPADPTVTSYSIYRQALDVIVSVWPCPWASAGVFMADYQEFQPSPSTLNIPYSKFHIPWIAYLSAPLAAGLSPPPELMAERTPGGGVILTATTERLDPDNPDHFRRARALSQILIERAGGAELPPRIEPF